MNPNCLYINIYMTFTLIIYIYISTYRILIHVTMYCYIHFTMHFLLLHAFLHVCNVVEKNRCPCLHLLMDTRQLLALAKTAEASMHTCVECQMTQFSSHSWLYWMQLHCIQLSVYNIYCTQYYAYIIKLCYIR